MSAVPARSLVVALAFLLALAAAPVASAQEEPAPETKPTEATPPPAATTPAAPAPETEGFTIAEVTLRTEDTRKALKELEKKLEVPPNVGDVEQAMYKRVLSIQDARRQTRFPLSICGSGCV